MYSSFLNFSKQSESFHRLCLELALLIAISIILIIHLRFCLFLFSYNQILKQPYKVTNIQESYIIHTTQQKIYKQIYNNET